MNVIGAQDNPMSPEVWEEPDMRQAVAARDISTVYRLLRRVGVSQRQIAALTGQSQSEVSEILKGRQVMAYDVLVRISNGLGIPREYMGLAYGGSTATSAVEKPCGALAEEEESVKRRKFVTHAAAMALGAAVPVVDRSEWFPDPVQTPAPGRIGMSDVKQVEAATRVLRGLDYQFGGGACRDAVVAQFSWSQRLITASGTDVVRKHLFRALADLQNLAGWTTFDIGLLDASRNHFGTALELAKESGDHGLMSNVLYRMGRVYLHHDSADEALKIFQLGQIAAQDSGSELAVAVLCANEAWAYARMGKHELAVKLLGRARDELSRATLDEAPDWAKFFDQNDLSAMIGTVYTELSKTDVKHTAIAIPALTTALAGYTEEMARSRAFNLSALATNLLRQGEVDHGVRVGREAFGMAITLKSARVVDRLEAVEIEAARRAASSDARDLSVHIRRLRVRTD